MEISLSDLLDRISILQLKIERIGEPHLKEEFLSCLDAVEKYEDKGVKIKIAWFLELYNINREIWDLESDIRKGKEKELGLEEVGRRALLIRGINKKRISVKNKIIEETGLGFKDVKMNHASE